MNFAVSLMNKLSYPKKMVLISVVFLIPIFLLITLLLNQLAMGISATSKEIDGLEYVKTVRQLYQHLPQHRGMTHAYLNGSTDFKSKILAKRKEIVADFAAIDAINDRFGDEFKTTALWTEIKTTWQKLESRAFNRPAAEVFADHTALIARTYNLFELVSNESTLILDPVLNTYYLMDAIVYRLPQMTESLGQSRGMASGLAAKGNINNEQKIALGALLTNINLNAQAIDTDMQVTFLENPQLVSELTALLNESKSVTENFVNKVNNELLTAAYINSNSMAIFSAGTAAIKVNFELYDRLAPILDKLLTARLENLTKERAMTLGVVFSTLLITLYLFVGFYQSMIRAVAKLKKATQSVSEGDLTVKVDCGTEDELKEVEQSLNSMISHLNSTVRGLGSTASLLASASEELSATTGQARAGAQEQQMQTDQIATAMNEMTATVQEVARNAEAVAAESKTADREAKDGGIIINETINAITSRADEVGEASAVIHELEKNSNDIGTVLDVIKSIAEQTNLLALNAAIEAARAGEHGRGFAVVADEVRTLASRTQESTEQIQKMVTSLQSHTHKAVAVMDSGTKHAAEMANSTSGATESIGRIVESVAQISDMSMQVASASEEQSCVSEEINRNIVRIADLAAQSMQGSEQIAEGSDELARLATELEAVVNHFKI